MGLHKCRNATGEREAGGQMQRLLQRERERERERAWGGMASAGTGTEGYSERDPPTQKKNIKKN